MLVTYKNRRGKTYYLHEGRTNVNGNRKMTHCGNPKLTPPTLVEESTPLPTVGTFWDGWERREP